MTTYSRLQQGMIRILASALVVMGDALVGVGRERQEPDEKAGNKGDQAVAEAQGK